MPSREQSDDCAAAQGNEQVPAEHVADNKIVLTPTSCLNGRRDKRGGGADTDKCESSETLRQSRARSETDCRPHHDLCSTEHEGEAGQRSKDFRSRMALRRLDELDDFDPELVFVSAVESADQQQRHDGHERRCHHDTFCGRDAACCKEAE
jgi:hypothetical protein